MHLISTPTAETTVPIDEIVDWDDLEADLEAGRFKTKRQFKNEVQAMFEVAEETYDPYQLRATLAGLFPEARDLYDALPDDRQRLTAANVIDIRRRVAAGEKALDLVAEYGVGQPTISDIVNHKTWRNVA